MGTVVDWPPQRNRIRINSYYANGAQLIGKFLQFLLDPQTRREEKRPFHMYECIHIQKDKTKTVHTYSLLFCFGLRSVCFGDERICLHTTSFSLHRSHAVHTYTHRRMYSCVQNTTRVG